MSGDVATAGSDGHGPSDPAWLDDVLDGYEAIPIQVSPMNPSSAPLRGLALAAPPQGTDGPRQAVVLIEGETGLPMESLGPIDLGRSPVVPTPHGPRRHVSGMTRRVSPSLASDWGSGAAGLALLARCGTRGVRVPGDADGPVRERMSALALDALPRAGFGEDFVEGIASCARFRLGSAPGAVHALFQRDRVGRLLRATCAANPFLAQLGFDAILSAVRAAGPDATGIDLAAALGLTPDRVRAVSGTD